MEILKDSKDYDVLIFMLYTYILNNSRDQETIEMFMDSIMTNLTES